MTAYRVWIGQINQTYVDVKADNISEARYKAARKWREEEVDCCILDVQPIENAPPTAQ